MVSQKQSRPRRFPALSTCVVLLVLALSSACSSTAPRTTSNDTDSAADAERLEALYRARLEQELQQFVEADVDFMTGMIAHHAQALVMSRLAPTNGANNSVQTLAARIINAQKDEIATMQKWLGDRSQPVPEVHIDGLNLMVHGVGEHHMHMPGMLSQAQLEELAAAEGTDFDRLFLTYMIEHHAGAVTMVHNLFSKDGAAQGDDTFKLASDIQVDQTTEIQRMKRMLNALPGESP